MLRALVLCVLVALAAPAAAQPAGPAVAPTAPATAPRGPLLDRGATIDMEEGLVENLDDEPRAVRRPSGFWTGYRPARGGAYKWPLLGVGVVVAGLTCFLMVRALRKASRAPRPSFPPPPATS